MTIIAPYVFWQEHDNNGDPLAGGKVYTYEAGTSTPKSTYTDSTGSSLNSNPVILDSAGRASIWLGDGGYKFIIKTSDDVTIDTRDNIGGSATYAFGDDVFDLSVTTPITAVHRNAVLICTGTITLNLLSVATAGEGFYFTVYNYGSGVVTIDPSASETVNDAATLAIPAGASAIIICDGDEWYAPFSGVVTVTGTQTLTNKTLTSPTINGGTITGITDIAIADGGTGASTASAAFDALKQSASDTYSGAVELATSAETITGTDTARATTPAGLTAALASFFAQSQAEDGYIKLNNGVIIQWGSEASVPNNAATAYTLPLTFPNAAWLAIPGRESGTTGLERATVSTTQVTLFQNQGSAIDINWIAIGN